MRLTCSGKRTCVLGIVNHADGSATFLRSGLAEQPGHGACLPETKLRPCNSHASPGNCWPFFGELHDRSFRFLMSVARKRRETIARRFLMVENQPFLAGFSTLVCQDCERGPAPAEPPGPRRRPSGPGVVCPRSGREIPWRRSCSLGHLPSPALEALTAASCPWRSAKPGWWSPGA